MVDGAVQVHIDNQLGGGMERPGYGSAEFGEETHRGVMVLVKLTVSPFLPEGEAPIRITERGIESDEDV